MTTSAPLFTIATAHGASASDVADLSYHIPADTAALMRNARMLARASRGSLVVIGALDEARLAEHPFNGKVFRFGVQPASVLFTNFTELGFDPRRVLPVWRNTASPVHLGPPELARLTAHGDEPSAGETHLTRRVGGAAAPDELLYVDRELATRGVFGVVEITLGAELLRARPAFVLPFEPKQETLRYFIVATGLGARELDQLQISDAGAAEEDRAPIGFARVPAAELAQDGVAAALRPGDLGSLVVFRSLTPVPRRLGGRRGLQLSRNGDILVAHLPQPGPERPSSDLIVRVSKPQR